MVIMGWVVLEVVGVLKFCHISSSNSGINISNSSIDSSRSSCRSCNSSSNAEVVVILVVVLQQ